MRAVDVQMFIAGSVLTSLVAFTIWPETHRTAPPTCDDAVSKLAARAEFINVRTDGGGRDADYAALAKFRTGMDTMDVSGHGRTPQEAAANALKMAGGAR